MPCVDIADSIVQTARITLQNAMKTIRETERWGARVVYGDTDSIFVLLQGASEEIAFHIGQDIADTITAMNPPPVKLKFEKVDMESSEEDGVMLILCISMWEKRAWGKKKLFIVRLIQAALDSHLLYFSLMFHYHALIGVPAVYSANEEEVCRILEREPSPNYPVVRCKGNRNCKTGWLSSCGQGFRKESSDPL